MAHNAARRNDIRALLEGGVDLNARDRIGATPLHWAASYGHIKIVRFLLDHHADANAPNNEGYTPLHEAALEGHPEVAALLIERGANVDARNCAGNTPLHTVALTEYVRTAEILMIHGANQNIRNASGVKPRYIATCYGCTDIGKLLAAYAIQAAWRRFRPRARAARTIQRHWIRAYWDPAYRVCQARLRRDFAALAAAHVPAPAN